MNKPMVRVYQGNGEFIDREMDDAEFAQYEIDQTGANQLKIAKEEKAAQRQAILDRLGLTADEAKLILG